MKSYKKPTNNKLHNLSIAICVNKVSVKKLKQFFLKLTKKPNNFPQKVCQDVQNTLRRRSQVHSIKLKWSKHVYRRRKIVPLVETSSEQGQQVSRSRYLHIKIKEVCSVSNNFQLLCAIY